MSSDFEISRVDCITNVLNCLEFQGLVLSGDNGRIMDSG